MKRNRRHITLPDAEFNKIALGVQPPAGCFPPRRSDGTFRTMAEFFDEAAKFVRDAEEEIKPE